MKGVSKTNPPIIRYQHIWDVEIVIDHIRSLGPNETLSNKSLTVKVATLIALLAINRVSELAQLDVRFMSITQHEVDFGFKTPSKTSKPGKLPQNINLYNYPDDDRLCPVKTIKAYLNRVKAYRGAGKYAFFIGFGNEHLEVTTKTISQWIRNFLIAAGVRYSVARGPHSIRSAVTSAAFAGGIPLKTILEKGRWSNEKTWQKHYHKNIVTSSVFETNVLSRTSFKQAKRSTGAPVK